MSRKLPQILLLSLFLSVTCGEDQDNFGAQLLDFHTTYNTFFRKYFGCPKAAVTVEECRTSEGVLDYVLYQKVVNKAKVFK